MKTTRCPTTTRSFDDTFLTSLDLDDGSAAASGCTAGPPAISGRAPTLTTREDSPVTTSFTVADADMPSANLTLAATATDPDGTTPTVTGVRVNGGTCPRGTTTVSCSGRDQRREHGTCPENRLRANDAARRPELPDSVRRLPME